MMNPANSKRNRNFKIIKTTTDRRTNIQFRYILLGMGQQEPTESHGRILLHYPATRKKSMGESVKYESPSHLQVSFKRCSGATSS